MYREDAVRELETRFQVLAQRLLKENGAMQNATLSALREFTDSAKKELARFKAEISSQQMRFETAYGDEYKDYANSVCETLRNLVANIEHKADEIERTGHEIESRYNQTKEDFAKIRTDIDQLNRAFLEGIVTDKTLTKEGKAADAKAVGEKLEEKIGSSELAAALENVANSRIIGELYTDGVVVVDGNELSVSPGAFNENTGASSIISNAGTVIINGVAKYMDLGRGTLFSAGSAGFKGAVGYRYDKATGKITQRLWSNVTFFGTHADGLPISILTGGSLIPSHGTNGYWDIITCLIDAPGNSYGLTQDMIIDTRGNERFCGFVESKLTTDTDATLTESGKAADAKAVGDALAEQEKTIPKVFEWANAELPFTENEISGVDSGGGFGSNHTNFADGKTYFRYNAGSSYGFKWANPNPQKGSLTITMRGYSQYSTTLSTKIVTVYTDGTDNSLSNMMRLTHGETVTYTTDPNKTVDYIRGNYDFENWVLLDMDVLSIVADYPAPTGTVKTVNGVEPDKNGNVEIEIPEGGGSGGASIDVTAEVGQTIVVKSIDENGKPTAWEAADFPEGGGAKLIIDYTTEEETLNATTARVEFLSDIDGNPIAMKNCLIKICGTVINEVDNDCQLRVGFSTVDSRHWQSFTVPAKNTNIALFIMASIDEQGRISTIEGSNKGVINTGVGTIKTTVIDKIDIWSNNTNKTHLAAGANIVVWEVP